MLKVFATKIDSYDELISLPDGGYAKVDGIWYCRPPKWKYGFGCLREHLVIENDDNTITVTPSILLTCGEHQWHGYLSAGIWREC